MGHQRQPEVGISTPNADHQKLHHLTSQRCSPGYLVSISVTSIVSIVNVVQPHKSFKMLSTPSSLIPPNVRFWPP